MSKRKVFLGGEFLIHDIQSEDLFTPEEFSEEQRLIRETALDFWRNEIDPQADAIESKDQQVILQLLEKAGEIGLNATDIKERYGGLELDKIVTGIVSECLGAAASFSVVHAVHTGIGVMPISYFGNEEQKQRYLPGMADGTTRGAYCLTEAGSGSDALNARTKARLSDDGKHYILNGEKVFITNAGIADVFLIYAKVDGEKFTCFIVENGLDGLSTGREEQKMGMRGTSTRSVILEDVAVPVENVLYEVGKGHKIAFNVLNLGRWKLCAAVVGTAKDCIAKAATYAGGRVQFGVPISSFGLIKGKLADMAVRTFIAESVSYRVAAMLEDKLKSVAAEGEPDHDQLAKAIGEYSVECSIAKIVGSEMLEYCTDEAVQIHGGYGYVEEYPAERCYRDSRINRIWEGTNEINRMLIPGTLLARAFKGRLPLLQAAGAVTEELIGYSPLSVELPDNPLASQQHMIKMAKKLALLVAGSAAKRFGTGLQEEQEVLAWLADIIIEIFAMESGVARAVKIIELAGEEAGRVAAAAAKVYVDGAIPRIERWAKQVVSRAAEGDDLRTQLAAVKKLTRHQPLDTVELRREIADVIIERERYPLGEIAAMAVEDEADAPEESVISEVSIAPPAKALSEPPQPGEQEAG